MADQVGEVVALLGDHGRAEKLMADATEGFVFAIGGAGSGGGHRIAGDVGTVGTIVSVTGRALGLRLAVAVAAAAVVGSYSTVAARAGMAVGGSGFAPCAKLMVALQGLAAAAGGAHAAGAGGVVIGDPAREGVSLSLRVATAGATALVVCGVCVGRTIVFPCAKLMVALQGLAAAAGGTHAAGAGGVVIGDPAREGVVGGVHIVAVRAGLLMTGAACVSPVAEAVSVTAGFAADGTGAGMHGGTGRSPGAPGVVAGGGNHFGGYGITAEVADVGREAVCTAGGRRGDDAAGAGMPGGRNPFRFACAADGAGAGLGAVLIAGRVGGDPFAPSVVAGRAGCTADAAGKGMGAFIAGDHDKVMRLSLNCRAFTGRAVPLMIVRTTIEPVAEGVAGELLVGAAIVVALNPVGIIIVPEPQAHHVVAILAPGQPTGVADGQRHTGGSAAGASAGAGVIAAGGAVLGVIARRAGFLPDVGALRGLGRAAAIGGTGAGVGAVIIANPAAPGVTLTVAGVAFGAAAHMLGRIGGIHIPGVGEVVGFGEAVAAIGTGCGVLRTVCGVSEAMCCTHDLTALGAGVDMRHRRTGGGPGTPVMRLALGALAHGASVGVLGSVLRGQLPVMHGGRRTIGTAADLTDRLAGAGGGAALVILALGVATAGHRAEAGMGGVVLGCPGAHGVSGDRDGRRIRAPGQAVLAATACLAGRRTGGVDGGADPAVIGEGRGRDGDRRGAAACAVGHDADAVLDTGGGDGHLSRARNAA